MLIYHASTMQVPKPDVLHSRPNLDFGIGFYATTMREQAVRYAQRFKLRGKPAVLNTYEFTMPTDAYVREFTSYDEPWIEYVLTCRVGINPTGPYDIVIGGIANDRIFNTLDLYMAHQISRAEALQRLAYENPNQQICFLKQSVIDRSVRFISAQPL